MKFLGEPLYPQIAPGFCQSGFGEPNEPESSLMCAAFARAMGEYFTEGVCLLDYGCGAGRFCNFMSGWLRVFKYIGLEPPR